MLRALRYGEIEAAPARLMAEGLTHTLSRWSRSRRERDQRDLVMRAKRGEREAFAFLWESHARLIHAILLSMVPDHEAEDLMQEVALLAWQSLHSFEDPDRFTPWLSTIARNLGRDALKRRARPESLGPHHEDRFVELPCASTKLEADDVMDCIRSLPEPYRVPLTLRLVLGFSALEIADRTGLTPGSVRVNLCRGMKLLRAACGVEP